ncbi:MAG: hypothetical protein ACXVQQ_02015 [Gaiellaceae bacterium]
MVQRRTLLIAVAVLLCAAALFAIGVLLVGHFGRTEARILGTTAVLALMSLVALPAVMLIERRRALLFADVAAVTAAVAAGFAVATVWAPGDLLGKLTATVVTVAVLGTQAGALLARQGPGDPHIVHRLYLASLVTGSILAALIITLTWAQFESPGYGRVMGSLAILDALFVALQPLLARLRPPMTPRPG